MGPNPIPGGPDRSLSGVEGTEGFAALLAGVMVPPPPQAVAQAPTLRSGNMQSAGAEGVDLEGDRTLTGGGTSPSGDAGDEGVPLDPRALLLRAGIRTGEPPRAPRGPSPLGSGATVAPEAAASVAAGGTKGLSPASEGAPDVLAATTGELAQSGKGQPAFAQRTQGPAGEGVVPGAQIPGPGDTEPAVKGAGPREATGGPVPPATLASRVGLTLPVLDVPLVTLPDSGLHGLVGDAPAVTLPASGPDGVRRGAPVNDTVARVLAAAGLDPADFPALQGATLSESGAGTETLPVTAADRTMTRLDPDFRVRLERVVERLQTEHGIDARFLEGFRPQLRQEHLYAQGRTAPGPVVTWTRNSTHTQGRAADLKLEGGAESYRILHQVAAEEGLRTLGMKDPGHVELPRTDGGVAGRSGGGTSTFPASVAAGATTAANNPGVVAGPQGVARVARVAQVAAPARPGVSRTPAARTTGYPEGADAVSTAARKTDGAAEGTGALGVEAAEFRGDMRATAPLPELGLAPMRAPVTPGAGMATVDRVAALEELRDSAPLGPMRRIDLRDADGQGTRVRIEMRGDVVQTEIRTPDGELAQRLEPASRELEGALERHGLELGRLKSVAEPNRGQTGGEDPSRQGQQRTPRDGEGAHDQPRHRPRPDHPDREYQP